MPSVSSIINRVKKEVQIHEDYLNYLINSELDIIREQILANSIKANKEEILNKISDVIIKNSKSSFVILLMGQGLYYILALGVRLFLAHI